MRLIEWFKVLLVGRVPKPPDPIRALLTRRQNDVADRLGAMKGATRDEVLREAYRRADRSFAARRR